MVSKAKAKAPEADKSQQLAAATVGAGAELAQAQTEPVQTVDLDQAAEAQGVDLVAGHADAFQEAADLPATSAEAIYEATANAIGASSAPGANLSDAVTSGLPDWLLGQFDVKAKSPAGFWRCQVQFLHSSPTRVFVVEDKANVPHDHDCEIPCCYLTQEEAKRVYGEPWLKVLIDSEVIKD